MAANGVLEKTSMSQPHDRRVQEIALQRITGDARQADRDLLATEEPLEIRIQDRSIAVVMRTPGEDRELAAGFLVTEGLVRSPDDIIDILPCSPDSASPNVIRVRLSRPDSLDLERLTRHVFTSSSCGICSKASIESVRGQFPPITDDFRVAPALIRSLPAALAGAQTNFQRTGGLHACGLFDTNGQLHVVREDVGRHNALDKLVGWAFLRNLLPLRRHLLLLSGRVSFEMMQKALAAGIPLVAALSAPTSLAVEFAHESGQTLIGFLRDEKMNVYAGSDRLALT